MAKIICVLYDDPIDGYPTSYARDGLPRIDAYPDGQTLPCPKAIEIGRASCRERVWTVV